MRVKNIEQFIKRLVSKFHCNMPIIAKLFDKTQITHTSARKTCTLPKREKTSGQFDI